MMEQNQKRLDMLDKIYDTRQVDFEAENRRDREILSKIAKEVTFEEIQEKIEDILEEVGGSKLKQEKEEVLDRIEGLMENYEVQIAYYSQKNYKRGFKDAISLYTQCLKEENIYE